MKNIKALGCNVTWQTIQQPSLEPIHVVNCYIEACNSRYAKKTVGYLYYVIKDCILKKDPKARMVVMGDFN